MISPSMLYAVAAISEGCVYLNGSPQNTFVNGIFEMAEKSGVYIGGSDFKTGQTRFKSMMMDFLSTCGIKVTSIASYNHLGNNDGVNLSQEDCFKSKELSKKDVVADVVDGNKILYPCGKGPDHCVVIKYIPSVGDSKRAIDEYVSDIFMGGKQTISVYNVCEDSLLATPVMLDLVLVTEYLLRKKRNFDHPVLNELSLFFKAPLPDKEGKIVNVFRSQHLMLEQGLKNSSR
jgi:myo-inositol-1-phosphate synthase